MDKFGFAEFTQAVVEKIREYLPESFKSASVELNTVKKNNDVTLTGITIRNSDNNIAPTIYLEQYFEQLKDGEKMSDILTRIADVRISHEVSNVFDVGQITDFERVKDKIVPRIISQEWNTRLLDERPHTLIADLAVTYHILLDGDLSDIATVAITNALFKDWDIDIKELHNLSIANMKRLLPGSFKSMSAVLTEMMGMDAEDILQGLRPEDEKLFVLTNESKMFGAASVLDSELMDRIKEQIGEFYIIPSSVHELILTPISTDMDSDTLSEMISEVNESQVSVEERLADHPFRYSSKDGLSIA